MEKDNFLSFPLKIQTKGLFEGQKIYFFSKFEPIEKEILKITQKFNINGEFQLKLKNQFLDSKKSFNDYDLKKMDVLDLIITGHNFENTILGEKINFENNFEKNEKSFERKKIIRPFFEENLKDEGMEIENENENENEKENFERIIPIKVSFSNNENEKVISVSLNVPLKIEIQKIKRKLKIEKDFQIKYNKKILSLDKSFQDYEVKKLQTLEIIFDSNNLESKCFLNKENILYSSEEYDSNDDENEKEEFLNLSFVSEKKNLNDIILKEKPKFRKLPEINKLENANKLYDGKCIELDRIVNLEEVKKKDQENEILCSFCNKVAFDPKNCCGCESLFGKNCFSRNLEVCYDCKQNQKYSLIKIFERIFKTLQIKCIYNPNGCAEILKYNYLSQHEKNCNFRPKKCPGPNCQINIISKNYKYHLKNCLEIIMKCEDCGIEMTRKEFLKHGSISCLMNKVKNLEKKNKMQNNIRKWTKLIKINKFDSNFDKISLKYFEEKVSFPIEIKLKIVKFPKGPNENAGFFGFSKNQIDYENFDIHKFNNTQVMQINNKFL